MKTISRFMFCMMFVIFTSFFSTPVSAAEDHDNEDDLHEISEKTGLDETYIEKDVTEISIRTGMSYEDALKSVLNEIKDQEKVIPRRTRAGYLLPLGAKGNSFYTQAYTSSWNHGHIGIFSSNMTIIHAPGNGKLSIEESKNNVWVGSGDYYLSFRGFLSDKIIEKARSLVALPYNYSIDNKKCSERVVNCSQLVYCAYLAGGSDVDSNGGFFVSPADIRDHKNYFVKYAY